MLRSAVCLSMRSLRGVRENEGCVPCLFGSICTHVQIGSLRFGYPSLPNDVGDADGQAFLSMEYVGGEDLARCCAVSALALT